MSNRLKGIRPRPRVAILGSFDKEDLENFKTLFPTQWIGEDILELTHMVHPSEIDLLIVGKGIKAAGDWPERMHVICFSPEFHELPGPRTGTNIFLGSEAETEEFLLPELSLPFNRLREHDLTEIKRITGWPIIQIQLLHLSLRPKKVDLESARQDYINGAIITDNLNKLPLSTIFKRFESKFCVAWLPNPVFDNYAWTELIAVHWAQHDPIAFPEFGDWTKSPDWMIPEEEELIEKLENLESEKLAAASQFERHIGQVAKDYEKLRIRTNKGRRRLITAQGDDLVEEVISVFCEFGFEVEKVDQVIDAGKPKKEDLRIKNPDNPGWEGIVEVRGYDKSGGKTSDFGRINRFADLYNKEKGRHPDKRVYVINGQTNLSPHQRQKPLASASEDLDVFAESGGLLISTLDLFTAWKQLSSLGGEGIRTSICSSRGRWNLSMVYGGEKEKSRETPNIIE